MGIVYDENNKTLTLHTKNTTYQMQVDRYGFLLHLYYGKRAEGCMDYLLTYYDRGFSGNPYDAGNDKTYSMDALPQEFRVELPEGSGESLAVDLNCLDPGISCALVVPEHDFTCACRGACKAAGLEEGLSQQVNIRHKRSGGDLTGE